MKGDPLIVVASYGDKYRNRWAHQSYNGSSLQIIRTDCPETMHYDEIATPYKGFDTGAFLWAYWTIPAEQYLFVQDSLIPEEGYADLFWAELDEWPVCAWAGFPYGMWDSPEQKIAVEFAYGTGEPEYGIFGPIFAARREALDTLRDQQLLPGIPNHKTAAQAKEREWATAFGKAGLPIMFLSRYELAVQGKAPAFKKEFGGRQ